MTLKGIFTNKKYLKVFTFFVLISSFFYLFFKNFKNIVSVWEVPVFSFLEKLKYSLQAFLTVNDINNFLTGFLVILFIFSISLFLLLMYLLFKESKNLQTGKGFWGVLWIFISILGLSCASCGIGLLVSILSFFGLSSLVNFFPMHGLEFGYLGVIALNISNYFLLKRLKNPYTCKP
ncbi:hypothetical protein SDC9_33225 [bioreactor metagenome]|uniref:Uncharacterized protein n=1 Tax=bioreactor metagenome TaxID=1076179 RepID=A0A644V7B8_9ZZZZ|nr:hypothetical protein [Candidatus Elulimicrobiales bacterium]